LTFGYYPYQAAIGVSESYDALNDIFERVASFLTRFHIYTEKIPLSPMMSDIMVKVMTEVLNVLALATKHLRQGRFSAWHAACGPHQPIVVQRNSYISYSERGALRVPYSD
jgi:hypothetical protein